MGRSTKKEVGYIVRIGSEGRFNRVKISRKAVTGIVRRSVSGNSRTSKNTSLSPKSPKKRAR